MKYIILYLFVHDGAAEKSDAYRKVGLAMHFEDFQLTVFVNGAHQGDGQLDTITHDMDVAKKTIL
jgi:hypothetical protein